MKTRLTVIAPYFPLASASLPHEAHGSALTGSEGQGHKSMHSWADLSQVQGSQLEVIDKSLPRRPPVRSLTGRLNVHSFKMQLFGKQQDELSCRMRAQLRCH